MINFFKIMMYFLNIYVEDTTKINVYIIGFVYANLSIRNVLLILWISGRWLQELNNF